MNLFNPRRCDQGDHDWKIAHDFIGDSDVAYGTRRITFRVCRTCGIENHERPSVEESPQDPKTENEPHQRNDDP
jgi:hypothetical protein